MSKFKVEISRDLKRQNMILKVSCKVKKLNKDKVLSNLIDIEIEI